MSVIEEPPVSVSALLSDPVTVLSLGLTVVLLIAAYTISLVSLAPTTTAKIRTIFIWHLFDVLVHFILEGSFVYHSLFSFATPEQLELQPPHIQSLPYRVAGALFSDAPMAKVWQVYAKADLRWGVGEPNIVSMELLTVVGAGSIAALAVYMIARDEKMGVKAGEASGRKKWFWMVVLATGELYGGFMTFVPEWIVGSPSLVTSNWVYKWLYLFFFNTLWVCFPGWILYEGYCELLKDGGRAVEKKKA
ncbi:Emopamil-binding protein [Terfezia boudieri ATCC MYA-4762]|uniref:Emopamil-binding protein n=1 Tax=Terfezia boudieri ATCC MYA-4762 TaxID=1051890 RepID=A0A3N4LQ68_9PEZI|nr:Emopamil-binding protein [Terfezia boudieri ATCC MYA-4762]